MPLVGTALDQLGQRFLLQLGRMPICQPLCFRKDRRQSLRNDEVAETQGWRERLRDRPEVDNPSGIIQGMQGRDRGNVEAVFAVVVVLDDVGTGALSAQARRSCRRLAESTLPSGYW